MNIDQSELRNCLAQFGTGVTVITLKHDAVPMGMTVNSFASLSLDPPLILWSIRRQAKCSALFAPGVDFNVNILAANQLEAAHVFASSASGAEKFAAVSWSEGRSGVPNLDGTLASLECCCEAVHEGGDHLIIVGRVMNLICAGGAPLLFVQGTFGVAARHPAIDATARPVPQRRNTKNKFGDQLKRKSA